MKSYTTTELATVTYKGSRYAKLEFLDHTHTVARDNPTLATAKALEFDLGSLVEVEIRVTPAGRRTVKSIRLVDDSDDRPAKPRPRKAVRANFPAKGGWVNGTFFPESIARLFAAADNLAKNGESINILLIGPSGYGKTTYAQTFADATGRDAYRVNCAAVRDPEEWFGYREARNGSTVFEKTDLVKLIERGDAVIIFDEFNRIEPWLQNTLLPILDHDRKTVIHGEEIKVGRGVVFVATLNEGAGFTGVFTLDQALRNRMDANVAVSALPVAIEIELLKKQYDIDYEVASQIVEILTHFRQDQSISAHTDASTRTSLKAARLVEAGLSVREALEYVLNATSTRVWADIVDYLNTQCGVEQ